MSRRRANPVQEADENPEEGEKQSESKVARRFVVATGKSVTSKRGTLSAGAAVKSGDFTEATVKVLADAGYLVSADESA